MDSVKGKVALITGSARGIGLATAELLGNRGAKLVISDVADDILDVSRKQMEEKGFQVLAVRSDVTVPEDCRKVVGSVQDRFGSLDILVNNAGVSIVDRFETCTPETCKRLMDVNLMGSIYMTLSALDPLKQAKGHIVFVSSVSGIRAIPTGSLYSASKAALRSFGESLRVELKSHGVHVGVIFPGFTTTEASKTVMKGDGTPRPINRPPHDTPEGVAKGIVRMIEKRERERVLTTLGRATSILQRVSPALLDRILLGRELQN